MYESQPYYFEPFGSSCNLYNKREQIGITHCAVWCVSRRAVVSAEDHIAAHFRTLITPRHVPDTTLDNLSKLVYELHGESDNARDKED